MARIKDLLIVLEDAHASLKNLRPGVGDGEWFDGPEGSPVWVFADLDREGTYYTARDAEGDGEQNFNTAEDVVRWLWADVVTGLNWAA